VTEAEWLACTEPRRMLNWLKNKGSRRKQRLFACACCRRIWPLLTDQRSRNAVDVAERYAEGIASYEWLSSARDAALQPYKNSPIDTLSHAVAAAAFYATKGSVRLAARSAAAATASVNSAFREQDQADLLRCIFGHLFFRAGFAEAWLTWNDGIITKLAQAIYEELAFDRMPILADALEEAGCNNVEILNHCRQPGEHVRGCWVIDALLGKS
jgi:hypothetical protein